MPILGCGAELAQVLKVSDEDVASIEEKLQDLLDRGVDRAQAQRMAVADVLAEVELERDEVLTAIREQHPAPTGPEAVGTKSGAEPAKSVPDEPVAEAKSQKSGTPTPEREPTIGLTDLQSAVDQLAAAGLKKVQIAETVQGLPEAGKNRIQSEGLDGVRGLYDSSTDTVWFVQGNIRDIDEALFVGLHEAFHRGLRGTLGEQVAPVLDQIYLTNPSVRRAADERVSTMKMSKHEATEETLADMAGDGTAGSLKGWDRLVSMIRAFIGKLGLNIKFTDQMVMDLVAGARNAGLNGDAQSGGIDTPMSRKPNAKGQGIDLPEFGKIDTAVEKIQNRYNRWKQTVETIREQGGNIDETNDFYSAEERYWGIVGHQADQFSDEVAQFVKDVRSDGLSLDEVANYAYALHAPERNQYIATINPKMPDGGSGMTDQEAQGIIDAAEQGGNEAALAKHAEKLTQWTAETRKVLFDNGLISQDELTAWEGEYQSYVPLRGRAGEKETKRGTGQGFDVRGKESKQAMGRSTKAETIIEHIVQDRSRALVRAGKNEVLRRFAKLVLDNPDPDLWEINAVEKKRTLAKDSNGDMTVTEHEQVDKLPEHTVAVKDGGATLYVRIHDAKLLEQLKNLNNDNPGEVVGGLLWANRQLSRMYTALNPVFALLTNPIRDVGAGTINMVGSRGLGSAAKFLANIPASIGSSAWAEFSQGSSSLFEEFRKSGGQTGFMDFKDIEQQTKQLRRMVEQADVTWSPETWVTGHGWKTPFLAGSKALHGVLDLVERVNGVMENATRFSAYKIARAEGATVVQAANLSKNLTTNFNRKGSWSNTLSAYFLFFNPAIQGSARMIEALKSPKVQAVIATGMVGMALLALQNADAGDDDDGVAWWDKIPDSVKERNLVIVLPPSIEGGEKIPGSKTGRYLKIPMPFGYNMFGVMANSATDVMRNMQDPKRGKTAGRASVNVAQALLSGWIPVQEAATSLENSESAVLSLAPAVLKPLAQNVSNVNGFGHQMYRDDAQAAKLPDSQNFGLGERGTVGQVLAEKMNSATGGSKFREGAISVTPASLNNALRGYGGAPVGFAMDIANVFLRNGVERDEPDWYKAPFVKQLYGRIDAATDRSRAYQALKDIEKSSGQLKRAEEAGDRKEVGEILKADGPMAVLGDAAKQTRKALTDIRKQEIEIIDSEKMTDTEKLLKLRKLDREARRAAQGLSRAVNRAIDRKDKLDEKAEKLISGSP